LHHEALDAFVSSCQQTVIPVKKAVGASEGQSHFLFDPEDPYSGAITSEESENTINVDLTTIDESLSKLQVEGPFLLKLDTHGYERSILKGAAQTLEKTNVLIIEAYNYKITDEAFLFWELCAYLSEKGFRPIDLVDVAHRKYDSSLWQMDLFFIKSTWEGFQYVSYK
jgi:FkbM family methyltransferase